jgi:hypothetical protein
MKTKTKPYIDYDFCTEIAEKVSTKHTLLSDLLKSIKKNKGELK